MSKCLLKFLTFCSCLFPLLARIAESRNVPCRIAEIILRNYTVLARLTRGGGGVLPCKRLLGMCRWMGSHFHDWTDYSPCQTDPGGGVLPYKRLLGMCRWMGSHFHDWTDYNGVAFLVELLEWDRTFSGFLG